MLFDALDQQRQQVLLYWLLGISDQKRHVEKQLIKEQAQRMLSREELLSQDEGCCVGALPNLCARFSGVKERVRKAEPKGSNPQSGDKACCHLGSGTEEEMRGSGGRIRE
jgi:hypothetical protein